MLEIIDTVIATAAVILGLSLIVEAIVQIIKQALDLKSSYMRSELLALFSNPARTSNVVSNFRSVKRLAASADGFAKRIVGEVEDKLRSFGFSDLHLLEDVNTGNMVDILGDLPVADDANLRDKFEEAVRSAERWFDITKRAFQEHYERRMKYWSFVISAVVVLVMNADLIDIFQEFSTVKPKRDAIVATAPDLLGTAQGFFAIPDSVASDADRAAIIKRNASLIDSLIAASSFSIFRWNTPTGDPLRVRESQGFSDFFAALGRNFIGWLAMTLLVSLGAPFWYDFLQSIIGIKERLRSGRKRDEGTGQGISTVVAQPSNARALADASSELPAVG